MDFNALAKATQFSHSRSVAQISRILAQHAGYPPQEVELIEQAALLHDLGKSYIPSEILKKPGALTADEFEIVKTHTAIGRSKIIEAIRVLSIAAVVAESHHEKMDGSGYNGICGDDIHPYARLISVADIYDALLSRRAYKEPWPLEKVLEYLDHGAGKLFDKAVVDALVESVGENNL